MQDFPENNDNLDFDFNWDDEPSGDGDDGQQQAQGQPQPQQPQGVDPAQFQQLQAQLQSYEQRWNNLQQVFGDPQQQKQSNEQILQEFIGNPLGFMEQRDSRVREMARNDVREEYEAQKLLQDFSQKNQDLAPFQDEVVFRAQIIYNQAQQSGQPLNEMDALNKAAQSFRERLGGKQSQGQTLQHMALKMDTNNQPQRGQQLDFWNMTDDQFNAFDRAQTRKHYQ